MIGLYVHVPYCTVRCSYCDFYLIPSNGRAPGTGPFLEALGREMTAAASRFPDLRADTLHFGGGTPSLLKPADIAAILARARSAFRLVPEAEIGLEANPEDLTPEKLSGIRDAGVTRLAIGVQAFDDAVLRLLRRPHDVARAEAAIDEARRRGFASLGVDLILGLPESSHSSALDGVGRAIALGVDHLSLYLLEIHDRTRLGRAIALRRVALPADDATAALYEAAADRLEAAGFEHYEISNFARPGHRSRHNVKYWTDAAYLGFGPSAHSYLEGRRWSNVSDLKAYVATPGSGTALIEDPQPDAVRAREALVAGLRLLEGIDLGRLQARYQAGVPGAGDPILEEMRGSGLVTLEGTRLSLTRRGRLVSNEVLERLI
ncbi:MAG TPA: radical SAM family heme chaperone HemW [Candidatus Polarisedimenticolia bacterium]|nr:radical SAM family heme chaperone HemW [Candidatus Polarisedimenticolia bacterium]